MYVSVCLHQLSISKLFLIEMYFQTNTYQMVVVTHEEESFVLFSYGDTQWGNESFVGFISPKTKFMVPGPGSRPLAILDIETSSNVGDPGIYAYRVDQESIIDPSFRFKGKFNIHA